MSIGSINIFIFQKKLGRFDYLSKVTKPTGGRSTIPKSRSAIPTKGTIMHKDQRGKIRLVENT